MVLCACGCGQIRPERYPNGRKVPNGTIYIKGHGSRVNPPMLGRRGKDNPNYGRKYSEESKLRISLNHADVTGDKNPSWKGDNIKYSALHTRMRKIIPMPDKCSKCGESRYLELCNIRPDINPDTYNTDPKNWWWGCMPCHVKSDGRINFGKKKGN